MLTATDEAQGSIRHVLCRHDIVVRWLAMAATMHVKSNQLKVQAAVFISISCYASVKLKAAS